MAVLGPGVVVPGGGVPGVMGGAGDVVRWWVPRGTGPGVLQRVLQWGYSGPTVGLQWAAVALPGFHGFSRVFTVSVDFLEFSGILWNFLEFS